MESIKITVIKTEKQYNQYCDLLEELIDKNKKSDADTIELLNLLIEKWDEEHNTFHDLDPVRLIKTLMEENNLKAKDLVEILRLSKGTISKILNYQKGLSKETIRRLSAHFKVSQEAFNRPYKLISKINKHYKNASLMNTKKDTGNAMAV